MELSPTFSMVCTISASDGVESEKIIRSSHSVQENPEAIQEVKRILHGHSKRLPAVAQERRRIGNRVSCVVDENPDLMFAQKLGSFSNSLISSAQRAGLDAVPCTSTTRMRPVRWGEAC